MLYIVTLSLPLQGVSHRHVSDHLSELVETVLADLEQVGAGGDSAGMVAGGGWG